MPETSYPNADYNAGAVTDAEYQRLPYAPNGLIGQPGESAAVQAVYANSSGREVHVRAGRYGSVLGRAWSSGTTELTLAIDANTAGSTRIDTAVLRLDRSTWQVRAAIRKGTAGGGAPALVRQNADTGLWEEPLADVTVPNAASAIAAGNVRMRALYQAGTIRPAKLLGDVSGLLNPGDIVYTGGQWLGWTGAGTLPLAEDSGDLTVTVGAGWAASGSVTGRRTNGWSSIDLNLARSGASVPEASDSLIATVPAALAPLTRNKYFGCILTGDNYCRLDIGLDGRIVARHAFAAIPKGAELRATLSYPR